MQLEGNWPSTTKVKVRILPMISHTSGFWVGLSTGRGMSLPCETKKSSATASQNRENASLVMPSPTPLSSSNSTLCQVDGLRVLKCSMKLSTIWVDDLDCRRSTSHEFVDHVFDMLDANRRILVDNL